MPGRLHTYQQTGGLSSDDLVAYTEAQGEANSLRGLSDAEVLGVYDANDDGVLDENEAGTYAADVSEAQGLLDEYADAYQALAELARGGEFRLTPAALDELNRMLGL